MKMMLCALVSLSIMFTMQPFVKTSACPLKGESTGGACSVKDIKNLEKAKMQEKVTVKEGQNLRPVQTSPEIKNPEQTQCIFCLQEGLFEKVKP